MSIGQKKHSLVDIVTVSPILSEIVNKVEQLAKLNCTVQQKLEATLAKNCRVANLRDGILILTTSSSTTGHLLQFAKAELLSLLRAEPQWCHLKSIKIHVRPDAMATSSLPIAKKMPLNPISKDNCDLIQAIANSVTSSSLQKALLKLIKTL